MLRGLASDEEKLDKAYKVYQTLSLTSMKSETFEAFDRLNTGSRNGGQHYLYSGMRKDYFKSWLEGLPEKVNNVLFISKANYESGLLKALRTRYQLMAQ